LERLGEEYNSTPTVDGSVEASTDATAKLDADARPGTEGELMRCFDVDFICGILQDDKAYHGVKEVINTKSGAVAGAEVWITRAI
jgi:hypothetical protein